MDYNGVRKERAMELLETATRSPATADEKSMCNRGEHSTPAPSGMHLCYLPCT